MLRASGLMLALSFALAGCGGGTSLTSEQPGPPDKPLVTDVMDGRWVLAAPNAPSCGLTFTAPSPAAGSATPDGGCPERFYLSRRWQLADGALTIVDADNTPLGTFRVNGDRFEGRSVAGTPITLSR
jgi:hypothetical protein